MLRLGFLWLCCFFLCQNLAQGVSPSGERKQLKIYRVGDLIGKVAQFEESFEESATADAASPPSLKVHHYYVCSPQELLNLICSVLSSDSHNVLQMVEHRLFAYLSQADHHKVKELLEELRREPLFFIHFELLFLEMPATFEGKTEGIVWSASQKAEAVAQGKILRKMALSVLNHQALDILSGTNYHYIRDYDVEIASNTSIGDPITDAYLEGLSLQLKGVVGGDLSLGVLVEGKGQFSTVKTWSKIDLTQVDLGILQLPEIALQSFQFSHRLSPDQVLALSHWNGENRFLLLIQPRLLGASSAPSAEVKENK